MRYYKYFLFSLVCLASCITEEDFDNTPTGNFEALWEIIDQHYCFLEHKSETIGLDWDWVHAKYHNIINDRMTNAQLREVLCNMLSELQDGHVNLYTASDVGRYWSWHEDFPSNYDSELQAKYLGTGFRIASGMKYTILPDNIGYIVYNSFSSGIGNGNISEVLDYMKLCNGLIIDVRDNGGGQLNYAEELSSHFTNKKILVGYLSHKTGPGHNQFSSPQAEYLSPSTGVRWQKPVIVLTNRKCYSATNTFVRNMLCCPQAKTLGDQTGGGSGLPFSSELPNGWHVRFSACEQLDSHMKHIEFGIMPTIPCQMKDEDLQKGIDTLIEKAREELIVK